jgi:hypothetical protein
MRIVFAIALAASIATGAPFSSARADDDWPADCPKPNYSWFPLSWPTERQLARMGCTLARKSAPSEGAIPSTYSGYVPPPPIGPDASTEQPPVVDQAASNIRAAERCRDAPESAMAAAVIPVELALCALSAPWRSEAVAPAAPPEPDPAVR